MAIFFFNDDINFTLKDKRLFKGWIKKIIEVNNFKLGDINFIFTSESKILDINTTYLNHTYLTDIITFPYTTDKIISSDIYICIPVVRSNAQKYNQSFSDELNRIMIHGVLHLIGYNDSNEEETIEMRKAEDKCLLVLKEMENAK
ncbi:MAG: rRNA maturation RNase YbeY [Bacteroidales bacterium]|nr:rRNA maturation RNase YbeY [Bacteroidales bacterium]MDD3891895.1 rRNA maturation RNase YbeY [Bacteroidales bacterium]